MRLNKDITKQTEIIVNLAAISMSKAYCAFDQRFGHQDCVFGWCDCVASANRGALKNIVSCSRATTRLAYLSVNQKSNRSFDLATVCTQFVSGLVQ